MTNERILEKIKKLMALANSSNPHEAANAMRKAQALMSEYQLSQSDVDLSSIAEHGAKMANKSLKQPKWSVMLTMLICRAFGVEAYMRHDIFDGCRCNFIGLNTNVEIAAYCYTVLSRQLLKARREYAENLNKRLKTSTKTARCDLFCEGWVSGVYQQVTDLSPNEKERELIRLFKERKIPNLETGKVREANGTSRDNGAVADGYKAGRQVRLNAGVSGREQMKIGSRSSFNR